MTYDFVGIEQGLTVLAGVEQVYELELRCGGEAVALGDVQLGGVVRDVGDGAQVGVVRCDVVGGGVVRMVVPELEVGEYVYEVEYVCSDGGGYRLLYGRIGVLGTGLELLSAGGGVRRRLCLVLPGGSGKEVQARWQASSVAEDAARRAVAAAGVVEDALAEAHALAAGLDGRLAEGVVANMETGTWWVGGRDTGAPWRGASAPGADVVWEGVATAADAGVVQLGTAVRGDVPLHVVPTMGAVMDYVGEAAVGVGELEVVLRRLDDVEGAGYVTGAAVAAAVAKALAEVPVFVEVSRAEYEALEAAGELRAEVYYLIYEDEEA